MLTHTSITLEGAKKSSNSIQLDISLLGSNENFNSLEPILILQAADAATYGESSVQLLESVRYEYTLSDPNLRIVVDGTWGENSEILIPSRRIGNAHSGIINTGLYTGSLKLNAVTTQGEICGYCILEIRSRKLTYRSDYQQMLNDITNQCIGLLQDWQSATNFHATPDISADAESLAQQFSFIRALLNSESFDQALHQIISNPHQNWGKEIRSISISKSFKPNSRLHKQIQQGGCRNLISADHSLFGIIDSLPKNINTTHSTRTTDTPENRFIKFAIECFLNFINRISTHPSITDEKYFRLKKELKSLSTKLENFLSTEPFAELSNVEILPLSSPTLQRRQGYREVLQAWMNFSIAAKLVWAGGNQVYEMGQRDVATLYEYWTFFELLNIVSKVFILEKPDLKSLITQTGDGFSIRLKAGKHTALKGTCSHYGRKLNICFSYNRSFKPNTDFTRAGSWTQAMRPDYTVSLWPDGFSEEEAEAQELMVHVHFDAKYRLEQITDLLWNKEDENQDEATDKVLDEVKQAEDRGTYKRADLLKMHAYRDAIRRSHGAYVIYPGNSNDGEPFKAFHEILPGLGAFALRPGAGTETLERFLRDIVRHVSDRTTARERQSFQTYKSYLNTPPQVAEEQRPAYSLLPEQLAGDRHIPPIDTYVLVGWYKNEAHLEWIQSKGKYNFRLGPTEGGLRLSPQVVGAHYLLLYGGPDGSARKGLFRIKSSQDGPEFINKAGLEALGYPTPPTRDSYAVFDVEIAQEFAGFEWKLTNLKQFPDGDKLGHPFATTLADLFGTLGRNLSYS